MQKRMDDEIRARVVLERSIKNVAVESKSPCLFPASESYLPAGTRIPIRDTRMIPEIIKTKNNHGDPVIRYAYIIICIWWMIIFH